MNTKKLTRKHIASIIVYSIILLTLIVAFICYIHEPRLIQDTNRKPDISFNGTTFDISAKDFVRIVNEDLDKEGLSLISEDYAKDQYGNTGENEKGEEFDFYLVEYTCPINKILELHLFSIPELGDGIAVIQLQSRKTEALTTKQTEQNEAYYRIICDNVEPRFNSEKFNTHIGYHNSCKLDDLLFYYNSIDESFDGEPEHNLYIYGIQQKDLSDKYPLF